MVTVYRSHHFNGLSHDDFFSLSCRRSLVHSLSCLLFQIGDCDGVHRILHYIEIGFGVDELILWCYRVHRRHHFFTHKKSRFDSKTHRHTFDKTRTDSRLLSFFNSLLSFAHSLSIFAGSRTQKKQIYILANEKFVTWISFLSPYWIKHWRCQNSTFFFVCHMYTEHTLRHTAPMHSWIFV